MPDRRRRTALHLPQPAGLVLLPRERQSSSTGSSGSSGSSGSPSGSEGSSGSSGSDEASGSGGSSGAGGSSGPSDDNPFAPPPEGRPDQPWQPRRPENGGQEDGGPGSGQDDSSWGSQWSSHQPGRSSDGFGHRPGAHSGQNRPSGQNNPNKPGNQNGRNGQNGGQDGPESGRGGLRWDPTDPSQRRARYALLSGMWAFFFALFDFPQIALLLGALALYWGVSSLRNKPQQSAQSKQSASVDALTGRAGTAVDTTPPLPAHAPTPAPGQAALEQAAGHPAPQVPPAPGALPSSGRPQLTAAVSGLVTAVLALVIVAATFTVQLAYRDYYACVNDALTKTGQLSCNSELPHSLVPIFGVKE
jgi:hypothetical protein